MRAQVTEPARFRCGHEQPRVDTRKQALRAQDLCPDCEAERLDDNALLAGLTTLDGTSSQRVWAYRVRAEKLSIADDREVVQLLQITSARWFINHAHVPTEKLASMARRREGFGFKEIGA